MKLHLPKLLLTAVLATCSMAQAETFSPLSSEDGWTTSKRNDDHTITFNTTEGKVEHSDGWGQQASTYNFDTLLTAEQGDITFSITLQSGDYSRLIGVALQGSSEAIVLGSPVYGTNSVGYAISDNPFGPFDKYEKILETDMNVAKGPGHHGYLIEGDDYYIVYHRRPLTETDGNSRQLSIDRMYFDGEKIRKIQMT